ncbi:MAG TPA: MarR family transcriptional regulator [Caulobacteraceae bacterium]|nr:MarR family transcriptional regulator [Caulobacteraceae bacterium]
MPLALIEQSYEDRAGLQLAFARALMLVGRKWPRRFSEQMEGAGQTYARWRTLFWISQAGDGVSQRRLADMLGVEEPTLVRLLDALQAQKMIERRPHPTDRRVNLIHMTQEAEPVLNAGNALAEEIRDEMLDGISSEDLATALSVLRVVGRRIEAQASPARQRK